MCRYVCVCVCVCVLSRPFWPDVDQGPKEALWNFSRMDANARLAPADKA